MKFIYFTESQFKNAAALDKAGRPFNPAGIGEGSSGPHNRGAGHVGLLHGHLLPLFSIPTSRLRQVRSCYFGPASIGNYLKRQYRYHEIFYPQFFFHQSIPLEPMVIILKCFRIGFVRFRIDIRYYVSTPRYAA
jgi:hypothetical protein